MFTVEIGTGKQEKNTVYKTSVKHLQPCLTVTCEKLSPIFPMTKLLYNFSPIEQLSFMPENYDHEREREKGGRERERVCVSK